MVSFRESETTMIPNKKERADKCLLRFNADFDNLEALRTEISSCLVTGRNLWLSYDEDAGIERLTKSDSGYDSHHHYELTEFFDLPAGQDEVDMEALAYAEPYLWFCGSMSKKRNTPSEGQELDEMLDAIAEISLDENRFSLGCIPCIKDGEDFKLVKEAEFEGRTIKPHMMRGGRKSSELHNALMRDRHLGRFMEIPCKDNGFDIEGLAVEGDRVFIGLRGPVLGGIAVILEINCKELDGELIMNQREGEDLLYRKHFVDLKGMGIRELNIDKKGDLYLLAGPTMDLDGTISIYRISGGLKNNYGSVVLQPELLFDVAHGSEIAHGNDKAEGMAFLDDVRVLITYDSPVEERLTQSDAVIADIYEIDE